MKPRIRSVKPELFEHLGLYKLEHESGLPVRLAFIGLFTMCDREGRFDWQPERLKLHILPYDENIDMARVLDALMSRGFIEKYSVGSDQYGCIPKWKLHQVINNRESQSTLPPNPSRDTDYSVTRHGLTQGEEKRREEKGTEEKRREENRREGKSEGKPDFEIFQANEELKAKRLAMGGDPETGNERGFSLRGMFGGRT